MLVVQEFVTADGFAADAAGDFGFGSAIENWSALDADQLELIDRAGMIVLGRKTYELFLDYWPTAEHVLAEPINTTARAVLSRTLRAAPWGNWSPATVHTGSPRAVIDQLAAAAAPKDLLVWGSLALVKSLFRAGVVDELRLIVCPVVLGSGITVTPTDLGAAALKLIAAKAYSNGAVALTYRIPHST